MRKDLLYNQSSASENLFDESNNQADNKLFLYFKEKADNGDAEAQFNIGRCYELGSGINKNHKEAFKYYKLAADQGHREAQYEVGVDYFGGYNIEENHEEAFKYFKLSAEKGYEKAQLKVGFFYEKGIYVQKNIDAANQMYLALATQGNAEAQYYLGNLYLDQSYYENINIHRAVKFYNLALAQEFKKELIEHKLAICKKYILNPIKKSDYINELLEILEYHRIILNEEEIIFYEKRIFNYYKKKADKGDAEAQFEIGRCYVYGFGIKKNHKEAFKYYKLAADQGYREAQYEVGLFYELGCDIEVSYKEAFEYYKLAADQGHREAQVAMGFFYENGTDLNGDINIAIEWFQKAAEQGSAEAQYHLGNLYFEKSFYKHDEIYKAIIFYNLALMQNFKKELVETRLVLCKKRIQNSIKASIRRSGISYQNKRKVDIRPYLKDNCISTLKEILYGLKDEKIFLDGYDFSFEEAEVIRDALIENLQFTFICPLEDTERIFLSFELAGYSRDCLEFFQIINPSTKQDQYGFAFDKNFIQE